MTDTSDKAAETAQKKAEAAAAEAQDAKQKADEKQADASRAANAAAHKASDVKPDAPVEGGPLMTSTGEIESIGSADESPQRANYFGAIGKTSPAKRTASEKEAEPDETDVVRKARLDGTVQSGAL